MKQLLERTSNVPHFVDARLPILNLVEAAGKKFCIGHRAPYFLGMNTNFLEYLKPGHKRFRSSGYLAKV